MARGLVMLLALATGFVVLTAGTCPPEVDQFCQDFPEFCGFGEPTTEVSDDGRPQLAVGEEASEVTQPELTAPEAERDQS